MIKIEYKLFFVITAVLVLTTNVFSQTVYFDYDASGNRTNRWLEVKVYPNPVQHELHIDISHLGDAAATGHLCDISGRPVLSFENLTVANTLNLETLAPGTYLLRVECKEERRVWKIVVR